MRRLHKKRSQRPVLLLMHRQINIYIRDKERNPLPGSSVDVTIDEEHFGTVQNTEGHLTVTIPDPVQVVTLTAKYKGVKEQVAKLGPDTDVYTFYFDVMGSYSNMTKQIIATIVALVAIFAVVGFAFYLGLLAGAIPLVLGLFLMIVTLALAFMYKEPTLLQAQLIRSTFALGAGCLASQIPGLLNLSISAGQTGTITAAGALAVYVIVFFFTPAKDN
ncbi:hypothetical protein [Lichenifustis flavocetrariae]|uniref:Uncharacterized protein n=1 Tax=Lichenifustis flavocetrariae TaxID=2949735 RepID=A0AA41Z8I8_9HYPH|nr:hypothetical protein [Lichenifustis flavocetrariae]MCW6512280.1 hypothetical protein [Lichenifustis flavocetrariae]